MRAIGSTSVLKRLCHVSALAFLSCVHLAFADEFASSLKADVTFQDLSGHELKTVAADVPFKIAVVLQDAVTGANVSLPGGLAGWIRPVEPTNAPCLQAARNYRASENQLPQGALDLNTALILNLTREANLHVVSPKLDLATANILSSARLPEMPASLIVHPVSQVAYFSLSKAGEVQSLRPYEKRPRLFVGGLQRPTALAPSPDGGLWVAQSGGDLLLYASNGEKLKTVASGHDAVKLQQDGELLSVLDRAGRATVLRAGDGEVLWRTASGDVARDVVLKGSKQGFSVFRLADDGTSVVLTGASGDGMRNLVKLADMAERIVISPDGRWLFAFAADSTIVSVVDVATSQLATAVSFRSAVNEIEFVDEVAFLRLSDNKEIASIALASLGVGKSAKVGFASFGLPQNPDQPARKLLLPLPSTNHLIAVQNGSEMGFAVSAKMQSSQSLPQSGLLFKGGLPFQIELIEQGFKPTGTNTWAAMASLQEAGQYEVVLTTGIQGMTSCVAFAVEGGTPKARPATASLSLVTDKVRPKAGATAKLHLRLKLKGGALNQNDKLLMRLSHLEGGWRKTVESHVNGEDVALSFAFPVGGTYSIVPLLPHGFVLQSVPQLEVSP